mgnify:CR=1 FL=1
MDYGASVMILHNIRTLVLSKFALVFPVSIDRKHLKYADCDLIQQRWFLSFNISISEFKLSFDNTNNKLQNRIKVYKTS